MMTELHPLGFFLPPSAKLLMLGSFPPPKARWSMDFYYPNIQNDMWRILGLLFYGDKDHFLAAPKAFSRVKGVAFCEEKGVALGDTACEVIRLKANASDKFLEVVKPTDVAGLLRIVPDCRVIVTTGEKATATLCAMLSVSEMPKTGECVPIPMQKSIPRPIFLYRLPSSSRAYPLPLEKKAACYELMFRRFLADDMSP